MSRVAQSSARADRADAWDEYPGAPFWLPWAALIVSVVGVGIASYLTLVHYDTKVSLVCSSQGIINCEKVTQSPQSMVFGIPVAVLGLLFFIVMAALNVPPMWRADRPLVALARLGWSIVGACMVVYLIFAELHLVHAICLYCTGVHVCTALLFALVLYGSTRVELFPARR